MHGSRFTKCKYPSRLPQVGEFRRKNRVAAKTSMNARSLEENLYQCERNNIMLRVALKGKSRVTISLIDVIFNGEYHVYIGGEIY